MSDHVIRRDIGTSANALPDLTEVLFIQAPLTEQIGVTGVASSVEIGAIFTLATRMGKITSKPADIAAAIVRHRDAIGPNAGVLIDANLYAGKSRLPGTHKIDLNFIDFQLRDLKLAYALAGAGFVAKDDDAALHSVLSQVAQIAKTGRRVVATLVLDYTWLKERSHDVRDAIEKFGIPVAIAIGHTGDPYAGQGTIRGLLHVLGTEISVSHLRSDLSSVGAIAAGATFGTIGSTSGLRHVFPATGGGPPTSGYESLIVPSTRGWVRHDHVAAAVAQTPDEPHWYCPCDPCAGTRLDTVYGSQIYEHNLHAAAELTRAILNENPGLRLDLWASQCLSAQSVNFAIQGDVGERWKMPDYLGAWLGVISSRETS
jgi:hypothetical protein